MFLTSLSFRWKTSRSSSLMLSFRSKQTRFAEGRTSAFGFPSSPAHPALRSAPLLCPLLCPHGMASTPKASSPTHTPTLTELNRTLICRCFITIFFLGGLLSLSQPFPPPQEHLKLFLLHTQGVESLKWAFTK